MSPLKKRPSYRSRQVWLVVFVLVLAVEAFSLWSPHLDPLTHVVIDQSTRHPEVFGAAVFLLLCWMLYHWFIAPFIRRKRDT